MVTIRKKGEKETMSMSEGTDTKPNVRSRIDKLHALMTEAIATTNRIVGDVPTDANVKLAEPADLILDVIEFGLDQVLCKMEEVCSRLRRIEQRL